MKKRILTLFMVGALTMSAFAFPVTARADEPEEVNTETESTEAATEEGTEAENQETESTETGPETETETAPEQPVDDTVGDELAYTLNTDTHKSDETPCQVTSAFYIPSGFHLNAYMDIMQDDGTVYRILTTDDNGYSDFAFVKPGHYIVLAYGIIDDTAGKYSFTISQEDFTLDTGENSMVTLSAIIDDYDAIAQTISDRTGNEKQDLPATAQQMQNEMNTANDAEERFPTNYDGVTIDADGVLYYETISNSKTCTAQVSGNATGDYDLYFEVVKAGVIGEAEFKISLDGGATFVGTDISANDYSFASHGLSIKFTTEKDTDELAVGDTFTAKVPETFKVSSSYFSQEPNLIVAGHPMDDYQVIISILSTGKRGVAKYSLSLDNGVSTEYIDTIPEDGVVKYGELTYYFADAEFAKDATYTCEVKSNDTSVSYVALYILIGVVAVAGIVAYVWLSMQKERASSYRIKSWKDRQDKSKYE